MIPNAIFNYDSRGVSLWYRLSSEPINYSVKTFNDGKYDSIISMTFDSVETRNAALTQNNNRLIKILSEKYDNSFRAYNHLTSNDPSEEPAPINDYLENEETITPIEII